MANDSFKGIPDARPASSTSAKAQKGPRSADVGNWKGIEDARPASGTKSQSVNVGGGSFGSKGTSGPT